MTELRARFRLRKLPAVILVLLFSLTNTNLVHAEPNLATSSMAGDLSMYPDDKNPRRFYYVPRPLSISISENGRPALQLLVTRYVGSQLSDDQGLWVNRNILSVRFHRPEISHDQKHRAREVLISRGVVRPHIVPLPLYGIEGAIQYTAVDSETITNLPVEGFFKNVDGPSSAKSSSLWSERQFSLSLGPNDAQLLLGALSKGGVLVSFSYAYLAKSTLRKSEQPLRLSGSQELVDFLQDRIELAAGEDIEFVSTVHADAIALSIEPENSQFHITKIDINDRLPPGYGSLDIYCYDFQQETVAGQYAKRIEIRAKSPTGKIVRSELKFSKKNPEVYAQSLNIPFAVNFAEPFFYRIISIFESGRTEEVTPWTEKTQWSGTLDITHNTVDG